MCLKHLQQQPGGRCSANLKRLFLMQTQKSFLNVFTKLFTNIQQKTVRKQLYVLCLFIFLCLLFTENIIAHSFQCCGPKTEMRCSVKASLHFFQLVSQLVSTQCRNTVPINKTCSVHWLMKRDTLEGKN